MEEVKHLVVLGAGSWGSALAIHAARKVPQVTLWARKENDAQCMQQVRENKNYLPDIALPMNLEIRSAFDAAIQHADMILIATPSSAFRDILGKLQRNYLERQQTMPPILYATKGLERDTGLFLHQIAKAMLGNQCHYAVLSGPSFAKEVALGLPTAVTIAASSLEIAQRFVPVFHHHSFRVYTNSDVLGVELGGAYKNVIAIAAGICDGLGFGANTRSALITRGLTEMQRLGVHFGAQAQTFMGLAGLGDLILTATDDQSRNRRFGLLLGSGMEIDQAEAKIGQVVEGKNTARELLHIAQAQKIDLPIIEQVNHVLYQNLPPKEAVENLLKREAKKEMY